MMEKSNQQITNKESKAIDRYNKWYSAYYNESNSEIFNKSCKELVIK